MYDQQTYMAIMDRGARDPILTYHLILACHGPRRTYRDARLGVQRICVVAGVKVGQGDVNLLPCLLGEVDLDVGFNLNSSGYAHVE